MAQIAVAGAGSGGEPQATASAVTNKKFKKLKKQFKELKKQVDQLARQPGPPGPPGSAPACQGNGSGDQMVAAGAVCIDKYEVSVWSTPTGGTQYGVSSDDYPCGNLGQNCADIYARSVPGVTPSRFITYFQAQQALANVGKRLPTNGEWQQAVAGTPDDTGPGTTPCNTRSGAVQSTGANPGCVSRFGANDMVGNLAEWVGDWVPASSGCLTWGSSDDLMCLFGASTSVQGPGALLRGGVFFDAAGTGPLAVTGSDRPANSSNGYGFRGAR